jgi:hypothetical protein
MALPQVVDPAGRDTGVSKEKASVFRVVVSAIHGCE